MTWLFSLYWLGALSVAGPILFHMWRRVPRGERRFSTLMFLTPSPPRITSRSRIEHWLLMLLRAVALLLIAFAFTRPLWRMPMTDVETASDEQFIAILVDTSASMRREALWENLVKKMDERIDALSPQASIALYQFDHRFVPIADFRELKSMEKSARREVVRARLKELKPTWNDTQLGEALVKTAMALQEIQTERVNPVKQRIWLASDLQSGSEIVDLKGYEWPDDLPVELVLAQPSSPSNAGLQVVESNPESSDDILRVRVTNAADSVKEQFIIRWETRESPVVNVYVPPGQSRIILPPKLPVGIAAESLLLEGDDHNFDNRVFVSEALPETRLVVYCGPETANDTTGARFFLDRVFSSTQQFQIELKCERDLNLASADAQPSLIVLVQPDSEVQPFVQKHLANGGTIVIASPTAESMTTSLQLCGRTGLVVKEASVSKYSMLGEIDFEHPIFMPFAESQFSDFTGIRFWKHRTIEGLNTAHRASKDDAPAETTSMDRILARFDDGDPAVVQFPVDRGQVILFAAGWHPADSQFARSSKFPTLMFRLLENSSGITSRVGSHPVGTAITWPTTSRAETATNGVVELPDHTRLTSLPIDEPFRQTENPGIYTISVPGRTEKVAVNLSADESRTTPLTMEQLESYGLKLKGRETSTDAKRLRDRQHQLQLIEMEQTQKLWQRILVLAILILLAETFLTTYFGEANRNPVTDKPTSM